MKLRKGRLFNIPIFLALFLICIIILMLIMHFARNDALITDINISVNNFSPNGYAARDYPNHIFLYNDKYCIIKNDGIYILTNIDSLETSKAVSASDLDKAYGYNEYIVASKGNTVYCYDSDFNLIESKTIAGKIEDFCVINEYLILTYSIDETQEVVFKIYSLPMIQEQDILGTDFVLRTIQNYRIAELDSFQLISQNGSFGDNAKVAVCKNQTYSFGTSPFIFVYDEIYSLSSKDGYNFQIDCANESMSFSTTKKPSEPFHFALFDDGKIIIVGISSGKGNESYSSKLYSHSYDMITAYDINSNTIKNYETKKYERILYADSKKVVTYYNGTYLTYSLEDWEVIDERKADEIKDGGSYTFEACGEYVFVFDDNTGELLNTICVA